jgi:hypothetical protein
MLSNFVSLSRWEEEENRTFAPSDFVSKNKDYYSDTENDVEKTVDPNFEEDNS